MEISLAASKTLHAQTQGNGLYRLALESEIFSLPLKKVIQDQLHNLRNSQAAILPLIFVVNVDGWCILDCEIFAVSKSDLYHG